MFFLLLTGCLISSVLFLANEDFSSSHRLFDKLGDAKAESAHEVVPWGAIPIPDLNLRPSVSHTLRCQNNKPGPEQWSRTRTINQDQTNEPETERKPEPGLVPIPDLHLEPRCKQHLFVQTAIRTPMIVGLPTKSLRSLSSAFRSLKICFDNNLKI